uniref:Zinc transporter ZIP4 N-terminal domain-containing protein n=1 Tax=Clastoptera arizonana TaxID=38151 RepID=A0A1B6DMN2_9HEMI
MKLLVVAVCLLSLASVRHCQNVPLDHRLFLWHLFQKYGHDGIISFEGFEHLLENLGIGGIKFDKTHTFIQHKKDDGTFQEIHDILKVHDHYHKRDIEEASNLIRKNDTSDEDLVVAIKITKEHDESLKNLYYESSKKIPTQCLSAQDLLTVYGFQPDHSLSISPASFLHICPAIIFELDQKSCSNLTKLKTNHKRHSNPFIGDVRFLWLVASVSVCVISVAGLLGIAVVPFLQKTFFSQLLNFLVALAVGTLSGDALLHILPHALKSDTNNEMETLLKAGVVFLTITLFFFP